MASKFDAFDRIDEAYTRAGDHEISASILIPASIRYGQRRARPIIVFWHGGGFVVGHRMYEPWWSQWCAIFPIVSEYYGA